VLLAILPLALLGRDVRLGEFNPFIPMVDATTALTDLIIATLLYVQASVFRSRALTVLASGYVYTALVLIPHALTFPGAFAPNGLLGAGTSTTAWLYIFWRAGFPLAAIFYVLVGRSDRSVGLRVERQGGRIALGALAATTLAVAVTIMATSGQHWLPSIYRNRAESNYAAFMASNSYLFALFIVAMGLLLWRRRSVLDMWLLVVLSAWLVQTLLLSILGERFTAGWYAAVVVVLLSHLLLMLALIAESSRLHARLALATAVQQRERDARLMSMDAVAAAISHEVGQPLSAIVMSATAGLKLLDREHPDVEKAMASLRATIEAGNRSFDVLKSIRAMFSKGSRTTTEVDLNELVRETAALLDRELIGGKVSLELALDDALPPVVVDRVQMQQVLVNLLINAMEAMGSARGRPRRIAVRSVALDERDVLLEVSDTGKGIAPEDLPQIFDAFYTTKPTGTGLGLSLCRTIVEGHGGRLWASPGEKHGAIFHLQLPRAALLAS